MSHKAAQYISQLDHARCDGNWDAVPELVRKVRKHAPDRSCLALTAESECAITKTTNAASSGSDGRPQTARPPTAIATPDIDAAGQLPKLLEAIDQERSHLGDKFQAQVCVGWLHWVLGEYDLCAVQLPEIPTPPDEQVNPADKSAEWTTVCALKAVYLKANCLARSGELKQALAAFQSGLPSLGRIWVDQSIGRQLRYWAELFLTEFCMLSSQAIQDNEVSLSDTDSLACFRSWAKFWDTLGTPINGGFGFKGSVPRRRIWDEYYLALSQILEFDLSFPTGYVTASTGSDLSSRGQLKVELKHVEATYQALLVSETSFPRADEERQEVENFVHQVAKNWAVLCGRGWKEQDLGQGGRNSLSRGVLDTLYSAATKTYHSTSILRYLFIVHLSVAEFELAFKSFDSYMEIVKKGKARVDKTGHLEPSLDDDATVLETVAQCIIALCRYGQRPAAEKARQLGGELEDWLAKLPQHHGSPESATPVIAEGSSLIHPPVPPHIIAQAWQAIGLAHAHWSRITYEASSRTEIQTKAIRCLRRSLAAEFGRSKDTRSFYALGLLLAERRELTAAIEVVKSALTVSKDRDEHYNLIHGPYWQERSLIPVWHLLALLLSARQDYVMASRACEGALEQFKNPSVLFGKSDQTFRSEHLKEAEAKSKSTADSRGLVDDMDDAEKESILEVKMTQLALIELLEGPEVAVNASFELLTLFSRLFGNVASQSTLHPPKAVEPPKTSGTLRSIKGSIFGHHDRSRPPTRQVYGNTASGGSTMLTARPATALTARSSAPTIQVTGENGPTADSARPRTSASSVPRKPRSNSLRRRERSKSRARTSSIGSVSNNPSVVDGEVFFPVSGDEPEQVDMFTFSSKRQSSASRASSFSRPRPLSHLSHLFSSRSTGLSEEENPLTASTNLLPLIQFPKDKERVQRVTILVRLWLMIAGFYRRAGMHEDCKGAITEAQRLVQSLESDAGRDPSGSGSLKAASWAEHKSVEDLWSDLWSELGELALAKHAPYAARSDFENALTHAPNHPGAIIGLSNILLDVYAEKLLPPPSIPPLGDIVPATTSNGSKPSPHPRSALPSKPLGLGASKPKDGSKTGSSSPLGDGELPDAYKADRLPLVDRLAARDRAYGLLSTLTKLGSSWNNSEAWFALGRAYEESGQPDKAKEVLWWCVELEEGTGVRDWRCLTGGGYIL